MGVLPPRAASREGWWGTIYLAHHHGAYPCRPVLLAYVDESYNGDKFWIAALLCPEHTVAPLAQKLDKVVHDASRSYRDIDFKAELHGHALFHGKDDWRPLRAMPRARIGVLHAAFTAIASEDVEIVIRGVDVRRLNARYIYPDHPHSVALSHLLERLDERADALRQPVLVIADEVDRADDHRRDLWMFQQYSTDGYRARQIRNIVDTIHFAPSRASRLVQAADLLAFLYARMRSGQERDERAVAANSALWEIVRPRIHHCHCWYP